MTAAPLAITTPKTKAGRVLLPWQERWRRDQSPLKIWEKSRRIGATYAEANDAVMNRLSGQRRMDYWFSSADESAAYEFSEYCRFWLKTADAVADHFTEQVEDPTTKRTATAFVIRFAEGYRITAMSSNPRRFRSKGGDVGLDEFAYHDEPGAMYAAAQPCTMWGGNLKILSTHNGDDNEFNKFVMMGKRHAAGQARSGDIPFSVHRITILQAVEEGLVERINETRGTNFTREQFLKDLRSRCRSEDDWKQEYLALATAGVLSWLPYDMIEGCENDDAGKPALATDGQRYIGMDVGETGDRTVIWTLERVGDVFWTREVLVFTDEPLRVKEAALVERINHPKVVRGCIDGTGVGAQIGQAAEATGKGESIKFSEPVKDALGSPVRGIFEDKRIRVPGDTATREDLHAIRAVKTAASKIRFDAPRNSKGHSDRFWALALALHAAIAGDDRVRLSYL